MKFLGAPNARYNVLKVIIDHFDAGDTIVSSTISGTDKQNIHVLGSIRNQTKRVLLINKRLNQTEIDFNQSVKKIKYSNGKTISDVSNNKVILGSFDVAVLEF